MNLICRPGRSVRGLVFFGMRRCDDRFFQPDFEKFMLNSSCFVVFTERSEPVQDDQAELAG